MNARLENASRCCAVWPPIWTMKPDGIWMVPRRCSMSSEIAPRSRPAGFADTRISRCWYFRSISTGATLRRMSAMVESTIGRPAGAVTKIFPRSSGRTRKGSSSCTTMLYWFPLRGSVKIEGLTLTFEFREKSAACATSRWLSPAVAAFSRSTTTLNCG